LASPAYPECQCRGKQAERHHRRVEDILGTHARLDSMADGQQEHQSEQPIRGGNRPADAEKLPDHDERSAHRFADHGEHGLVLDLPGQHARRRECRHQKAEQKQRAEAEVDQQFVVVFERVAGDVEVENQRQQPATDQYRLDRLADRFHEGIPGERENEHGGSLAGAVRSGKLPVFPKNS